jgi:2-amino-4-hydroxy-6-hydroxymethyldihydropteridine diphosphokinase
LAQDLMIGLGANLPSLDDEQPIVTARNAVITLSDIPRLRLVGLSRWYESAPIPPSGQPPYINGVVHCRGEIDPVELLTILQRIEQAAGRRRGVPNAARTLDLDIIAMGDLVRFAPDPIVPHPRAHLRAFVLRPMADVMPHWVHPKYHLTIPQMLAAMPYQGIRAL